MAKILTVFIFNNNLIEFSKLGVAVEGSSESTVDCRGVGTGKRVILLVPL